MEYQVTLRTWEEFVYGGEGKKIDKIVLNRNNKSREITAMPCDNLCNRHKNTKKVNKLQIYNSIVKILLHTELKMEI